MAILSVIAVGQVLKGSISGTATDPQGAVIKDAKVKATNTATLNAQSTTTDSAGSFRFNLIPAGDYTIEIEAPGFQSIRQTHITVVAGNDTGLGTLKLPVGSATTTVEVTAAAPLIESTQAQVTNTFSGQTLTTQPGLEANEGLDYVALFAPGVASSRDNAFADFNGGVGFGVNGLRGRNNDQQIDGQNNNDNSVAGPSLTVTDPEWVSQYVLVTNNFGPEYGRNAGSVVNVITKQGGNQWHGSIYGYENNSVLNSMTNFQKNFAVNANGNPLTKPPRLNDEFTGVTLGGPWVKNRFFLAGGFNQQFVSTNTPFPSGAITPTPAGLTALASCFPTGASAQAVASLAKFGPFAISGGNPVPQNVTTGVVAACPQAEFGTLTRTLSTPRHVYDFFTRTDVTLNHDTFVARYIFNRNNLFSVDPGLSGAAAGYPINEPALAQAVLASWTHNFGSRMVNELRLAYGRLNVEFGGNSIGNTVPVVGQLTSALSQITFSNPAVNLGFGPINNLPQGRVVNTWQAQDNWNYVLGRHTVKAGVNWTYQQSPNVFLPNINGTFRFTDWNAFFANTPNRVQIANGVPELGFKEYDTFAYVGDDWKVNRSLTLNLGLTWTYYGKPADLLHTLTVQQQLNPATALWIAPPTLPLSVSTNPGIPGVYNSFGPSVGFAWAPQGGGMLTGHGKTVIRGGYRLSYDPPYYNIYLNVATSSPQVFLQTFSGPSVGSITMPAVPTGPNVRTLLSPFLQRGVFDPQVFNNTAIVPNFKPDQVSSWSFGIQREVAKNSAVEVRYVGNHALHLFQTVDGNPFISALQPAFPQFVPPGLTPCPATAQIGPGAGTDLGRVTCGPGVVRERTNDGFSHYNAVQAEFRANGLYNQLTLRTGYTYSKTSDNVSEIFSTAGNLGLGAGNTLAVPQNPTQPVHGEYSFSGLDYPNTFYVLGSEQLPFFREQHGWVGHILGGWAISANYLFQTGQRYTPVQASGLATLTAAGNFYDSAFLAAFNFGFDSARPFVGNLNAPETAVGIFAGDACSLFSVGCSLAPGQLISVNAINTQHGAAVAVTSNQVRFIMNGGTAQSIFGTPFGNAARNVVQDARTNIGNLAVSKSFNIKERASFEFRATCVNVLNHPNFQSVDPFLEDAGNFGAFNGFGNPHVSDTVSAVAIVPQNVATRRLIFGGAFRF
ncbi:MAG TPA: carboxypeptidase regulatory-like domain-containing protein [Candidatus Angelobacter sp.]